MVKQFAFFILLLVSLPIFSDVDIDATLVGIITSTFVGTDEPISSGVAKGSLTLKSTDTQYVKSQLTLDFTSIRDIGVMSISKAWIKFRYPLFRVTLGKNRITWGEGQAFNAGDVIFDDYKSPMGEEEGVDLTADELKSMNRTMAQLIFPLGRFSYAESIYLPYDFFSEAELSVVASGDTPKDRSYSEHSYGGRFVTKLGGMKFETGYIYNGEDSKHKPYISINGTLLVDYHLSSSINIISSETDFDLWRESFKISSGLFYLFDLENDKTLTLRLESLVKPFNNWGSDALLLYPEVTFIPNIELALFLRAIINPLDLNINSTFGVNWKTYEGFSIGAFISNIYSSDDTESSVTISVTHKF